MCKYETHQHLHIGYYENGHDLVVIAYKKRDHPSWDVFIEEYEAGQLFEYAIENNIGEDINEEQASLVFEKWLVIKKII